MTVAMKQPCGDPLQCIDVRQWLLCRLLKLVERESKRTIDPADTQFMYEAQGSEEPILLPKADFEAMMEELQFSKQRKNRLIDLTVPYATLSRGLIAVWWWLGMLAVRCFDASDSR